MIPCKFFTLGTCKRGNACRYSHEMMPPHVATAKVSPSNRQASKGLEQQTEKIDEWAGENQTMRSIQHDSQIMIDAATEKISFANLTSDSRSQVPCHYFAHGRCQKGSLCPYAHVQSDEEIAPETEVSHLYVSH